MSEIIMKSYNALEKLGCNRTAR